MAAACLLGLTLGSVPAAHHNSLRPFEQHLVAAQLASQQNLESPRLPFQIVLKGERHCATNFVQAILNTNYGDDACEINGGANCWRYNCATFDPATSIPDMRTCCLNRDTCSECTHNPPAEPSNTTYCCWKHGYANPGCVGYTASAVYPAHVFVVRSVYPWLLSLHAAPYDLLGPRPDRFSDFLRAPFDYTPKYYMQPDVGDALMDRHVNPVQMWNAKLRSYMKLIRSGKAATSVVRVRALYDIGEMSRALRNISSALFGADGASLELSWPEFVDESNGTANDKMASRWARSKFDEAREYEANERWRELLSQEDLECTSDRAPHFGTTRTRHPRVHLPCVLTVQVAQATRRVVCALQVHQLRARPRGDGPSHAPCIGVGPSAVSASTADIAARCACCR